MAEFCYYCIQAYSPDIQPESNDEPITDTCEGCGTGLFLSTGKP